MKDSKYDLGREVKENQGNYPKTHHSLQQDDLQELWHINNLMLHIDTDDEIEGGSFAVVEVLLNLKEDIYPNFSQPNSLLQNSTRPGKSKMISLRQFSKLQT